ncbi:EpsG family protein [Turicibacter bilis]|uniref:EpsG family protein n=1 Tax=Turicibacter bilis TaxID=2735723 RepID=A0ABY5JMM2_9FIRM|nr:EpsG family protein [Turicibacter bilis]MBS3200929.1 EpsG family protein [Turicibacter bilis]UUF07106.1 EpsG family protein [Turicibacter bilis]
MEILFSLLLVYLILASVFNFSNKYPKMSFFLNLLLLSIITGSVYEKIGGGGDYDNYRNIFNSISLEKFPDKEIFFYYLNLLIKSFTDNFSIAFLCFMFIINFFILAFIYKYSKNIDMSLLMYVIMGGYITSTNITRQFIAIALVTYSIRYLIEKKYVMYILFCVLSVSFHTTAIIPIFTNFLISIFNEKIYKNYIIYFIFINCMIIVEPLIRKIGIEMFYENYSDGYFNYGSNILHYVVQLAFIGFYIINLRKVRCANIKLFINLATMASMFTLMSRNMVLYARFASYFNIFHVVAMVNILFYNRNIKEKRLFYYLIFIGLLVYYVLLTRKAFVFESSIVDYFRNL